MRDLDYFKQNAIWHQAAHDMIGDNGPRGKKKKAAALDIATSVRMLLYVSSYYCVYYYMFPHSHVYTILARRQRPARYVIYFYIFSALVSVSSY